MPRPDQQIPEVATDAEPRGTVAAGSEPWLAEPAEPGCDPVPPDRDRRPRATAARSPWRRSWERFRGNRLAFASLVAVGVLVLVAFTAPWLAPYDPDRTNYGLGLAGLGTPGHLFGTDELGRDIGSRLLYGLRTALLVAFIAEILAVVTAIVVGLIAGYLGGRADSFLMAVTDIMYAFPTYLFAVLLVTVMGRSMLAVIIAIAIAGWVTQARLIRAQVMSIKKRDYVEAARAMGAPGRTIATRYILPNSLGPILVTTSFAIPSAITTEAGLSLLGLGIVGVPSWGSMINDGVRFATSFPHMLLAPALAFAITLLAFTWIGDGVRDAFDVTQEEHS